jgi:hypothetical protein
LNRRMTLPTSARKFLRFLVAPAAIAAGVGLTIAGAASDPTTTPAPAAVEEQAPALRVGLQAGHWLTAQAPAELAWIRTATGTAGGGTNEWELNLDIARRVAPRLEAQGILVDVLPATVPPGYQADAFVALHADGDLSGRMSGYKIARASRSTIPDTDDALVAALNRSYAAATGLRSDNANITRNMTGYYTFNSRRYQHAIAPTTPAAILEMGFLTNASDRRTLLGAPDQVVQGVTDGILAFLKRGS